MTAKSSDKVTVKQLLSMIPDQALSELAVKTGVDYQAKVLFGKSMFYLLLYGLAERRVKMELEELLTIIIVKACGGNPDIVFR
jgi:hypothetical protein